MINENGSVAARAFQLPLNISRSAKQLASSRVLNHLTLLGFQDKDRSFDPSGADVPLTEKQTETLEALAKFWSKAYTREVQGGSRGFSGRKRVLQRCHRQLCCHGRAICGEIDRPHERFHHLSCQGAEG